MSRQCSSVIVHVNVKIIIFKLIFDDFKCDLCPVGLATKAILSVLRKKAFKDSQIIYCSTILSNYIECLVLIYSFIYSALHLAIIHNHQDVVLQLLDVLPQLPPTETPVVDCLNNFKQVQYNRISSNQSCLLYSLRFI